jgi:Fe-S-cluster containining protein
MAGGGNGGVTPARRVRALSIHAGYRCRHAGACCTSGWAIPVEPQTEGRLRAVLRSDRCFREVAGLPHDARVVLRTDHAGRCVFFDPSREPSGLCTVHGDLGEDALPSSCRHFPRVVTLTPLGVSVTLSHYCPTAVGMLFDPVIPRDSGSPGPEGSARPLLSIVENPPAFPAGWPYEGLDARESLPPLLRPGVLMDWPSLERWERFAVSVLAEEERSPEAALDVLATAAEDARRWTAAHGPFGPFFEGVLDAAAAQGSEGEGTAFQGTSRDGFNSPRDPARKGSRGVRGSRGWQHVADCVPPGAPRPVAPEGTDEADERWVAPAWPALSLPIRRWLAARAFASWIALQGEGLRTTVALLRVALGVLRAEAVRGSAEAARVLDRDLLQGAVRRADLLLLHLADPEALARRISGGEAAEGPPRRVVASPPAPP